MNKIQEDITTKED